MRSLLPMFTSLGFWRSRRACSGLGPALWNPTIRQSPTWRNPTIAEPDQSSKLRPGPALQNPIVHLDPIWQHLARAHSAKPDPGATLQNPTRAYSAEPDLTNRDPSRQPASQSQSQRASQSTLILAPASYQAASQPQRGGSLAACHGSRLGSLLRL